MSPPAFGSSWPWAKCLFLHHRELHGRDESAFPSSPGSQLACSLFSPSTGKSWAWASSPDFPPGSALMIEMWSSTTGRELGANSVWPWANQVKPPGFNLPFCKTEGKYSTSLGLFWGASVRNPWKVVSVKKYAPLPNKGHKYEQDPCS